MLTERARRRGIPAAVRVVGFADVTPWAADVYLIGGEDTAQLWTRRNPPPGETWLSYRSDKPGRAVTIRQP